ncbi:DUF4328 domain-containing protein [Kitasatospora griseola]|uniref:DUF4328 domain-containing protein n=1 Tax=Kitasatospora griseola TaxID=2064 RepID=UPI0036DC4FD1
MDRPTAPANPRESARGLGWALALQGLLEFGLVVVVLSGMRPAPEVVGLAVVGYLLLVVVSCSAGAVWVRKCWRNAEALAPGSQPYRLGLTTAGWLIPVANLWMRWRILLGLWRTLGVSADPILVHLLCVVAPLSALGGLLPGDKSAPVVADIVLTVLFIQVVRRITARQSAVLDVPAKEDWEAAVEADRAKLSAK